ncbi:MAG: 50S ribosomal protein L11 methyltransferase [Sphingomonadaceae bacterium]|nr:50S ribosomal protein L11 methyltransferase [Sphingomonadaceae bacterium]
MSAWQAEFRTHRAAAEAITDTDLFGDIADAPILVAHEVDEAQDDWRITAYFNTKPREPMLRRIARALGRGGSKSPKVHAVADEDWVAKSQSGFPPVEAGRFFIHTRADPPSDQPGVINFEIAASQAFGTGHHATTEGCLHALDRLQRRGARFATVADIGTGTGLLAFAAQRLWPRAKIIASDIDPASVGVAAENARINAIALGQGRGKTRLVVADGTRHAAIAGGAPYDLIIANILAGPLIALAPALATIAAGGSRLILAGLIERQRADVAQAYARHGFRVDVVQHGEWPVLTLTMRTRHGARRKIRSSGSAGQPPGDFGSW